MIIKDKDYGDFDVTLGDDGTMDTVVVVDPLDNIDAKEEEISFSTEYGTLFREDDGTMTDEGFAELAEEAVDAYVGLYLI